MTTVLSACGKYACESDTFETSGLVICHNNLDVKRHEVDRAVDLLELELNKVYPKINNIASKFREKDVMVVFLDENLAVDCEEIDRGVYICEKYAGGVNVDSNTLYVGWHPCLGFTAFPHELLHSVENFYLDIKDGSKHDTPYFFAEETDPYTESIEYKVEDTLQNELDRCQLI